MTISAHRSRLIWSPLAGWVVLSCSLCVVYAQSPTQSDADPNATTTPSVPAGGAAPVIVTSGGTSGTQSQPGSLKLPPLTPPPDAPLTAPTVPSASTTIVNSPFGASVPYYGGISGLSSSSAVGGAARPGDETGIGLGPFTLTPMLEVSTGLDSNVFAQGNGQAPTGSMYTTISPSFELKSDWSNHLLHVLASGAFGYYYSAPTQNYQNYGILIDGKVDIHHDIWAFGTVGFRRATEALGTPNVAFAKAPTVVDTLPVEFGFHQEFNNFFYEVKAGATRYWHYDNSVITSQGLPAQSRDRFEYSESLRLGYHVNEDVDIFLTPSLQQVRYLEKINSAGQQRDADGSNIGIGASWKINEISKLDGEIGLQTRNDPTQGGSTSALSYGLKGSWTGYAPLTLRPTILRSINETALSNYKNYVSTTYALDFNYEIHNEWTLAGGLMFQTADYNPAAGSSVGPRTDFFMRGQIGLLYSIKPEIQIGPFFEYSRGSSTDSTLGPSYDRQIYSLRLIAKR
ncbi:MAG: outer membrane beta-barrel protein [Reyranella sp.]|uniref:outer membrane beta-barrel protein n=1 Tax=Reyranella sp. TaxID=1929291 RepID=UPI001AC61A3D|nr:outer membrane beta-barrel protein [Reyranella sp.]MBN9088916.1 outer membrane beta-barrel protein [Reyranella sp.]